MAKFYIDTAGVDDPLRSGGIGDPWLTLAYACTRVITAGDIIHINPGLYTETVASALSVGVHIEGEGDTSEIHSHVVTAWVPTISLSSGSEGTNGNQTITYLKMTGGGTAFAPVFVNARSNVIIHHCTFEGFDIMGVTFNGKVALYDPVPPTTYATGNKFYSNIIIDCAEFVYTSYGNGNLQFGGQDGMLVHHNVITATARVIGYNGYPIKYYNDGYNRGCKIYSNYLEREAPSDLGMTWNFAIEMWNFRVE